MYTANDAEHSEAEGMHDGPAAAEEELRRTLPLGQMLRESAARQQRVRLRKEDILMPNGQLRPAVTGDLLPALLLRTNLRELLDTEQIAQAAAAAESPEVLSYLQPAELQRIAQVLHAKNSPRADFLAAVLGRLRRDTGSAVHRMSFSADPLSESSVRAAWDFTPGEQDGMRLIAYKGTDTDIVIPYRIGTKNVTAIDPGAFRLRPQQTSAQRISRRNIWRIAFPGTIHTIPRGLFSDCAAALTSIVLSEGTQYIEAEAFSGCALRSIALPDSVEALGRGVFRDCTRLCSAELPAGLTVVPAEAFQGCTALERIPDLRNTERIETCAFRGAGLRCAVLAPDGPVLSSFVFAACADLREVTIRQGVSTVPAGTFADCHQLADVQFAPSVRVICADAFARCRSLQELVLPNGLETIGARAFTDCWGLQSIRLPGTVRTLETGAFEACAALQTVTLPDGVRLGSRIFASCPQLSDVRLPEQLADIPSEAFLGCSSLRRLDIPNGTKRIKERAFSGSGLRTAAVPAGTEEIQTEAFSECAALRTAVISGNPKIWPAVFMNCKSLQRAALTEAVEIPWEMFRGCTSLASFRIAESVQRIGGGAFSDSGLETITVPHTVRQIGEGAFAGCRALRSVQFEAAGAPGAIQRIAARAFAGCTALRSVVIPEGVREIGDAAFQDAGLERIVLPSTLRTIHAKAFSGCSDLREVIFTDAASGTPAPLSIGAYAFENCTALEDMRLPERTAAAGRSAFENSGVRSVVLPRGLQHVGRSAFRSAQRLTDVRVEAQGDHIISDSVFADCVNLSRVTFEGSITRIGAQAFRRTGLQEIILPASVRDVGNNAFRSCSALRTVEIRGTPSLGTDLLRACHHLTSAVLPETLRAVPARMFRNCTRLHHIVFPPHLESIGERAFQGSGLAAAPLPAGVRSIGEGAFFGCRRLKYVSVPNDAHVGRGAFLKCPGLASQNGTVVVQGTVYGSGRETRFAYVDSKGRVRPPREGLQEKEEAPAALELPSGAGKLQLDPLLMLPEIVYAMDASAAHTEGLPPDICPGDIVKFGRFPQSSDFRRVPVHWIVLNAGKDEVQLAAVRPMLFVRGSAPMERAGRILNNEFIQAAFSEEERTSLGPGEWSADMLSETDAAACGLRADPTEYARTIAAQYCSGQYGAGSPGGIFVRPVLHLNRRRLAGGGTGPR